MVLGSAFQRLGLPLLGGLIALAHPARVLSDDQHLPPVESLVFDTQTSATPTRFQYQWCVLILGPDGQTFARRVVVERDGPKHGVLILTEDGFPLAHLVDNVALAVAPDRPGETNFYSGGGFRFFLGLTEEGKLGFAQQGVIPADGSRSRCDVTGVFHGLGERATAVRVADSSSLVFLEEKSGRKSVAKLRAVADRTSNRTTQQIESLSLRSSQGGMDFFGFDFTGRPLMSILEFSPLAKEMLKIDAQARQLGKDDRFPEAFDDLGRRLSIAAPQAEAVSDKLHLRFARNQAMQSALSNRHLVLEAIQPSESEHKDITKFLSGVSAALDKAGLSPGGATQTGERSLVESGDPYLLSWHAEAGLGPMVVTRVRDRLINIATASKYDLTQRTKALSLVCRIGWIPSQNDLVRKTHDTLTRMDPSPELPFDRGVDWKLVNARP